MIEIRRADISDYRNVQYAFSGLDAFHVQKMIRGTGKAFHQFFSETGVRKITLETETFTIDKIRALYNKVLQFKSNEDFRSWSFSDLSVRFDS